METRNETIIALEDGDGVRDGEFFVSRDRDVPPLPDGE